MEAAFKAIIPLVMVVAVLGMAFAMWSETLMMNVTVNTGEVKVKFSGWGCSDTGPDPQAEGFSNSENKDVATCSVDVELYDDSNPIKLHVVLNNTYPGYSADITVIIDNIGTIPVKLLDHEISGVDTTALSVSLTTPEDTQIEPGGNSTYILHIEVLQDAEENTSYPFDVSLTFAQWNEV